MWDRQTTATTRVNKTKTKSTLEWFLILIKTATVTICMKVIVMNHERFLISTNSEILVEIMKFELAIRNNNYYNASRKVTRKHCRSRHQPAVLRLTRTPHGGDTVHAELICTARAVFYNRAEQFIRTLCIIGGQSDTLYTWWSVGHFVDLVALIKSW